MTSPLDALGALPYFTLPTIPLGKIDLQPFGILVATGVLLGAWIGRLRGKYLGVTENEVRSLTLYLLIFGFLGAHLFDTLFYNWDRLMHEPWLIVKVWDGISSYGGFIGGVAGWYIYCTVHKANKIIFGDITMWGFLAGFSFGRMGCTVVHDHPGARLPEGSDFFLAIDYPHSAMHTNLIATGGPGPRHDLGFYELMFLCVLIAALLLVTRGGRARRVGYIIGFLPVIYGPVRFMLDYLRLNASDPRYVGLTFAQWTSILLFGLGIFGFYKVYKAPAWQPQAVPASESDVEVPDSPSTSLPRSSSLVAKNTDGPPAAKKSVGAGKVKGTGKRKKKKPVP
jgi:phosphatidylglycerol---prolipoprotein diacylglyceryl transferase